MDEQTSASVPEPDVEDELAAMSALAKVLTPLNDTVRARVISWAADRFDAQTRLPLKGGGGRSTGPPGGERPDDAGEYDTFAELFDRLSPRNDEERVLAAMYWLQVVQHQSTMKSLEMTKILTDLGHRVDRIRNVLPGLQSGKPARVLQVSHGSGPKGRRVVKLSDAGIKAIDAALASGGFADAQ